MNTKSNIVFLLFVAFVCFTIVDAAPSTFYTSYSLNDSSTSTNNNEESNNYSQLADSNASVTYEPSSVLNVTVNDSAEFQDKPSVLNVTDIITPAEVTTYGPETNSTIIVVTPDSETSAVEMGFTPNITNSTNNDLIFAIAQNINSTMYEPKLNSTDNGSFAMVQQSNLTVINDSTVLQQLNSTRGNDSTAYEPELNSTINNSVVIANVTTVLQQSNSTSENESTIITTYMPELNYTVNYSTEAPQQWNSTENNSTITESKPETSNSTVTNTSTVDDVYAGLQLGSEEINDSDTEFAITNHKARSIIQFPAVRRPTKVFRD